MLPLQLKHIGKIDAVGTVQVFGYSARRVDRDLHDLAYLNYAGPPTASDAVWARLIERRALDLTDLKGRPHRLRHGGYPGLEGKEAPFTRFVTRIESLAIDHCILLDKRFFEPGYDFDIGLTFVFGGDNMAQKIGHHVSRCVDIAVFPQWYAGLVAIGRREQLVTPLINWAHPVYQVTLDRARWTNLIALAVEREELTWPGEEPTEAAKKLLTASFDDEPEPTIETPPVTTSVPYTVEHEGDWTWLRFSHKPDDAILDRLRAAGFRWGKRRRAWYARNVIEVDQVEAVVGVRLAEVT